MSLRIPERFITDLENFSWGEDWRAIRIVKEKRSDNEYYFAYIVRYYGEKENTHDYDLGTTTGEQAWLGRNEKFVGKRTHDRDPDSPTFGKRIYNEAITETITEPDRKGKPIEREILVEGKTIYEYTIPVNVDNTKKMKTLVGAIALNQETQFLFVYGVNAPLVIMPDTFWKITVNDYLTSLEKERHHEIGKKV
jgi:hypothetical protein